MGLPEKLDRFSLEGKAQWVNIFQDLTAVIDSMGLCLFTSFAMGAEDYAGFFNLESGIKPEEDTLPKRLLEEEIPEGPSKGWTHKLDVLLPENYQLHGWTRAGIPGKERLKELGLE